MLVTLRCSKRSARRSYLPVETRMFLPLYDSFPVRSQDDGLQREGSYPEIQYF